MRLKVPRRRADLPRSLPTWRPSWSHPPIPIPTKTWSRARTTSTGAAPRAMCGPSWSRCCSSAPSSPWPSPSPRCSWRGALAVPAGDLGDRRGPAGHLRHPAGPAVQVPGARPAHAGAVRRLPDHLDGPDVVHELRRRHPLDQGRGGRADRRLVGRADPRRTALQPHGRHHGLGDHRPVHLLPGQPGDGTLYKGTEEGLEELDEGDVTVENDKITAADGYTMLDAKQVNAAGDAIR